MTSGLVPPTVRDTPLAKLSSRSMLITLPANGQTIAPDIPENKMVVTLWMQNSPSLWSQIIPCTVPVPNQEGVGVAVVVSSEGMFMEVYISKRKSQMDRIIHPAMYVPPLCLYE